MPARSIACSIVSVVSTPKTTGSRAASAAPDLAPAAGACVHVDGAFGLWAMGVPSLRHLASGMETADSWATDG